MKLFALHAGGFNAIGTIVVAAPDLETALELANNASDRKFNLTYHGIVSGEPVGESLVTSKQVVSMHEWGLPDLPSKGSGIKVTF